MADCILIVGYKSSGEGHDRMLCRVLQPQRKENSKMNKDKCHFRCTSVSFYGEIVSRQGIKLDPKKLKVLTDMPPPRSKKEL